MSFSDNLRELMKAMDITATELSAKTDISRDTINSYLKTKGPIPSADKAVKIAQVLQTSVEFLITGFEKSANLSTNYDIHKMRKYAKTINALDSLPEFSRSPIENMINNMSEKMVSAVMPKPSEEKQNS